MSTRTGLPTSKWRGRQNSAEVKTLADKIAASDDCAACTHAIRVGDDMQATRGLPWACSQTGGPAVARCHLFREGEEWPSVDVVPADTAGTYWNCEGKHQALSERLKALIPPRGECDEGSLELERMRQANNCYYDLWNNGLCNRYHEFRELFGITGEQAARNPQLLDRIVDGFILAAAIEQGLLKETT